jgi:PAS domain S-box-containing protein
MKDPYITTEKLPDTVHVTIASAHRQKPNILVVDDLETNVDFIEHILKPLDVNIISAFSGEEAITEIKGKDLALALIDLRMPGMDGDELASRILGDSNRELLPIIFISAHARDELQIEKCYESGIVDFIQKPFLKSILLRKVRVFLELYRQKNQILESERMYHTLLNASPESILVMDLKGCITDVSRMAVGLFGSIDRTNLLGKMFFDLSPREEKKKLKSMLSRTLRDSLFQNVEVRLSREDHSQFPSEISMTLITENGGTPKALMAIIRDITQRQMTEQQVIHTERLVSLGEMATSIAHEINQPLNTISLSLENVFLELNRRMAIHDSYFQKKSDKILENISRIRNIIDHIRAFSRDRDDYVDSQFDLHESIGNAISIISEQFRNRAIEISASVEKILEPVRGNTYRFEQVILNLLINARDAIEEKRRKLGENSSDVIGIRTYKNGKYIFVDICDDGIGIKPEDLQKIMLPFFTTKEPDKGTGLGLSISYSIIRKMNGRIEVESDYLKGTTMRIILPIHPSTIQTV